MVMCVVCLKFVGLLIKDGWCEVTSLASGACDLKNDEAIGWLSIVGVTAWNLFQCCDTVGLAAGRRFPFDVCA